MEKYELIKETSELGEVIYYIERNGYFVEGSGRLDLERAKEIYDNLISLRGKKVIEVIETTEV